MKFFHCLLLGAAMGLCSCGDYKEYPALAKVIADKYGIENVEVGIRNNELSVFFAGTTYIDSTDEVKQRVATEIGEMIPVYIKSTKIKKGEVTYERSNRKVDYERNKGVTIVDVASTSTFDMKLK